MAFRSVGEIVTGDWLGSVILSVDEFSYVIDLSIDKVQSNVIQIISLILLNTIHLRCFGEFPK